MSKWVRTLLVLTSSVLGWTWAATAWAQTESRAVENASLRFTNVEVVAVDLGSRTVVVRGPDDGATSTFSVASAVAGLADLRPGDRIIVGLAADRNANGEQIASIQGPATPARTIGATGATAPAAVTPAGELVARVLNADPNARTLTVRVPRRADRTLRVDAAVSGLEQLRRGDKIRMTLQNGAAGSPQLVTGIRTMSSSPAGRSAAPTTPSATRTSAPASASTANPRSAPATAARPSATATTPTANTPATTPAPAQAPGAATAPGVVAPGTATAPGVAAPGTATAPGVAAPGTATGPGVAAPGTVTAPGVAAPGTVTAPGVAAPGTTTPNVTGANPSGVAAVSGKSAASTSAPAAAISGAVTGAVTSGRVVVGAPAPGGTTEGPSLAAGLFMTTPVAPVTAPLLDNVRPTGASPAAAVPDAVALADARRLAGTRDFSTRLAGLAQRADEIDLLWMRYKTACGVEVAPNSTQAREWFTIWEGGGTPVSGSVDCDSYYDELVRHGDALKSQVTSAEASAKSAGVEPGTIRSVFDNYRMEWSGWGRSSPPLRRH